jgi:nucleotide-binding universal stress UspA family protein
MLKDIIVHLDGSEEGDMRLVQAEAIARNFHAHLIGLYTNPLPEYPYVLAIQSGLAPAEPTFEFEQAARKRGDLAIARIKEHFAPLAFSHEIRRIDAGLSELPLLCASQARWADLFISILPYHGASSWDEVVETVLFESGHAVYLMPPQFKATGSARNVLIAWRDTRESARAIVEALPFLAAATHVRIVTIDVPAERHESVSAVMAYLDHHRVKAEFRSARAADESVAAALLNEAHAINADLVIMGAYGHSRFREWVLGGTTRGMIERSDLPILLAH